MTLASTRQNCSLVTNASYEGNQTVLNRTRPDYFFGLRLPDDGFEERNYHDQI